MTDQHFLEVAAYHCPRHRPGESPSISVKSTNTRPVQPRAQGGRRVFQGKKMELNAQLAAGIQNGLIEALNAAGGENLRENEKQARAGVSHAAHVSGRIVRDDLAPAAAILRLRSMPRHPVWP